jgi:hypothetical protein
MNCPSISILVPLMQSNWNLVSGELMRWYTILYGSNTGVSHPTGYWPELIDRGM